MSRYERYNSYNRTSSARAWVDEVEPQEITALRTSQYRLEQHKLQQRKVLRKRLLVAVAVVLAAYAFTVYRGEVLVRQGAHLSKLQRQEQQLTMQNNELKIAVEELKGPERITGIAEKQLGMRIARSNIYVKGGN